ncbi:MAG TPA: hypothetical protein VJ991_12710 [Balneolales bacterium]|nr:hypothetical protein [Balneolales bacterium]
MKKLLLLITLSLFFGLNIGVQSVKAQVMPEFELATRGVMSLNGQIANGRTSSATNDFSDSGVLLGLREKLYNDYRGRLVVGFQFPDAESNLGQIYFHQVFVQMENHTNTFLLGRTRLYSRLIDFPTLRDDDALDFTDVLNPFSNGINSQDSQFGNIIQYGHVFNQRYWIRAYGAHFAQSPSILGIQETNFSTNGGGGVLEYRVPNSQIWNRPVLQQLGLGANIFSTRRIPGIDNKNALTSLQASTIINLKRDPVNFVDLRHQTLYNLGFSGIPHLQSYFDLTRAKSVATYTALRFLHSKLEVPTYQLSLGFGYKTFMDLKRSTNEYQLVANGFYRIGENFDVGLQYEFKHLNGNLQALNGGRSTLQALKLAVIFSTDFLFNKQFDSRNSLLNLEHGYIN